MRPAPPVTAVALLAMAVAGCGAQSTHALTRAPASSNPVVDVTADPSGSFDFLPHDLAVRSGRVTVEMYNPLSTFGSHGIAIEGHGVHAVGPVAQRGDVTRVTAALKPGRYELYSPVDAKAGNRMAAILTVHRT